MEYLATTRTLPRLIDVVKSSTKEKVRSSFLVVFNVSKGSLLHKMSVIHLNTINLLCIHIYKYIYWLVVEVAIFLSKRIRSFVHMVIEIGLSC